MAAAAAYRTSPALGSSQRCNPDTKTASVRKAAMLRYVITGHIISLLGSTFSP
jgi:hypothetical protein